MTLPFSPKEVVFVAGPFASGKTTAACRMVAAGPVGTWVASMDMGDMYIRRRLLAAGAAEETFLYDGCSSQLAEEVAKHRPPLVVVDGVQCVVDPKLRRSALDLIKGLIVACRSAGSDSVWLLTEKLKAVCLKGVNEGAAVTLAPLSLNRAA